MLKRHLRWNCTTGALYDICIIYIYVIESRVDKMPLWLYIHFRHWNQLLLILDFFYWCFTYLVHFIKIWFIVDKWWKKILWDWGSENRNIDSFLSQRCQCYKTMQWPFAPVISYVIFVRPYCNSRSVQTLHLSDGKQSQVWPMIVNFDSY